MIITIPNTTKAIPNAKSIFVLMNGFRGGSLSVMNGTLRE